MPRSNPPAIVRANNPCALRPLSRGQWLGQSGVIRSSGGLYCAFFNPVSGVRAGLRNLHTYRHRHSLTTPRDIIGRWAPANDRNPETVYAGFLARRMGISPDEPIPNTYDGLRTLIASIIRFECGYDAVGPEVIAQAMALMASEEQEKGHDPTPYIADSGPLKPLTRSKEIAIGGSAATIGVGGVLSHGREALEVGREAAQTAGPMFASVRSVSDFACIASFVLLAIFGLAIVANRLRARARSER